MSVMRDLCKNWAWHPRIQIRFRSIWYIGVFLPNLMSLTLTVLEIYAFIQTFEGNVFYSSLIHRTFNQIERKKQCSSFLYTFVNQIKLFFQVLAVFSASQKGYCCWLFDGESSRAKGAQTRVATAEFCKHKHRYLYTHTVYISVCVLHQIDINIMRNLQLSRRHTHTHSSLRLARPYFRGH